MMLDMIVKFKRKEIIALKKKDANRDIAVRKTASKGRFYKALRVARDVAVIAEIKRRSPSKGLLRRDFDPVRLAREFEKCGAAALSVLTDRKFFGGSLEILKRVKAATNLPILRKDFILDEAQVRESANAGADAILLIAAILKPQELKNLSSAAAGLGLDVIFEVHDKKDAVKVLALKPRIVGVNNRDLRTFKVDLRTTERLAPMFSKRTLLVSESGIFTRSDIDRMKRCGAKALLVGESLMRKTDAGQALRDLLKKKM